MTAVVIESFQNGWLQKKNFEINVLQIAENRFLEDNICGNGEQRKVNLIGKSLF